MMFKYRYPQKHTKIYLIVVIIVVLAIVGWSFASGKLDSVINKDKLLARWDRYTVSQLLKQDPNNYDALIKLGISNYVLRNFNASRQAYERAVVANPEGFLVWNNLGNVLRDTVNFMDAKKAYLEAIRINPNYIPAYVNLADLYAVWPQDEEGDLQRKKIIPLLQQGLKANPENEQLQNTLKAYISANK